MRFPLPRLLLASLLLAAPALAAGAQASPASATPAIGASRAGVATPAPAPLAEWRAAPESNGGAPVAVVQNGPTGREKGLMIVGGVALVAGAIVGGTAGTLVSLGGAAVALYGLYLFASR